MNAPQAFTPETLDIGMDVIGAYAALTDDYNPIHVDPVFAASTPMGGVIAHGTLSMCLLYRMVERNLGPAAFSALDLDVRFVKPVRIGDRLVAGGAPRADAADTWDVWVRAGDGQDRVAGTLRIVDHDSDNGKPA